jgi:hypothetical protein
MRRSGAVLAVVVISVVATFFLANFSSAEASGGNCQDKLVGKSYNCTVKVSDSSPESTCFEFETGGTSVNFDLFIDGTDIGGCVCDTTGSYSSPSFDDSSSSFECVGQSGLQYNGKIKSKKLSGQGSGYLGASRIYTCMESATPCS